MELLAFLSVAAFWAAFLSAGVGYCCRKKKRIAARAGWACFYLGLALFSAWSALRILNSM